MKQDKCYGWADRLWEAEEAKRMSNRHDDIVDSASYAILNRDYNNKGIVEPHGPGLFGGKLKATLTTKEFLALINEEYDINGSSNIPDYLQQFLKVVYDTEKAIKVELSNPGFTNQFLDAMLRLFSDVRAGKYRTAPSWGRPEWLEPMKMEIPIQWEVFAVDDEDPTFLPLD